MPPLFIRSAAARGCSPPGSLSERCWRQSFSGRDGLCAVPFFLAIRPTNLWDGAEPSLPGVSKMVRNDHWSFDQGLEGAGPSAPCWALKALFCRNKACVQRGLYWLPGCKGQPSKVALRALLAAILFREGWLPCRPIFPCYKRQLIYGTGRSPSLPGVSREGPLEP